MKSSYYDTKTFVNTSWNNHDLQLNLSLILQRSWQKMAPIAALFFRGILGESGVSSKEGATAFI